MDTSAPYVKMDSLIPAWDGMVVNIARTYAAIKKLQTKPSNSWLFFLTVWVYLLHFGGMYSEQTLRGFLASFDLGT